MQQENTKDKILEVAHALFAEKGLEGTSIRDIAREAHVNTASINYHFQSKQRLYEEVIRKTFFDIGYLVRMLTKECHGSTAELALQLYRLFLSRGSDLKNSFKIILSAKENLNISMEHEDEMVGPPGGKVLLEMLQAEVLQLTQKGQCQRQGHQKNLAYPHSPQNRKAKEEDLIWGVKVIFAHVIHMALLYHSGCRPNHDNNPFYCSQEFVENGIVKLVKVVLQEIHSSS